MNPKPKGQAPSGDDEGIVLQSAGDADLSRWLLRLDDALMKVFYNDAPSILNGLQEANVCWMEAPPPIRPELPQKPPSVEVMGLYSDRRYPSEWSFQALGLGDDRYNYRLHGYQRANLESLRYLAIIRKYVGEWAVNAKQVANSYGMLYFKGDKKISVEDFNDESGEKPSNVWDPDAE